MVVLVQADLFSTNAGTRAEASTTADTIASIRTDSRPNACTFPSIDNTARDRQANSRTNAGARSSFHLSLGTEGATNSSAHRCRNPGAGSRANARSGAGRLGGREPPLDPLLGLQRPGL